MILFFNVTAATFTLGKFVLLFQRFYLHPNTSAAYFYQSQRNRVNRNSTVVFVFVIRNLLCVCVRNSQTVYSQLSKSDEWLVDNIIYVSGEELCITYYYERNSFPTQSVTNNHKTISFIFIYIQLSSVNNRSSESFMFFYRMRHLCKLRTFKISYCFLT